MVISLINTNESITRVAGHHHHCFHLNLREGLNSVQGISHQRTQSHMTVIPFPYKNNKSSGNELYMRIATY